MFSVQRWCRLSVGAKHLRLLSRATVSANAQSTPVQSSPTPRSVVRPPHEGLGLSCRPPTRKASCPLEAARDERYPALLLRSGPCAGQRQHSKPLTAPQPPVSHIADVAALHGFGVSGKDQRMINPVPASWHAAQHNGGHVPDSMAWYYLSCCFTRAYSLRRLATQAAPFR